MKKLPKLGISKSEFQMMIATLHTVLHNNWDRTSPIVPGRKEDFGK